MDYFFQAAAAVMIAVVLSLMLAGQGKQYALLLSMAVCVMVLILGAAYLQPVMDFLEQLESLGNLSSNMTGILLKAVGISLISEIAGMICADSGNGSLGKALQILASGVILWLSIPIFNALLEMIRKILEEV